MRRPLFICSLLAFSSVTASAGTITVCASGCDYTSINDAIAASNDGDIIQLSAETYFEGEQIDSLGKAIMLRGVQNKAGEPASVLDGAGTHRVLISESGEGPETVFENLVIQNGQSATGGGMYNINSSSPTLTGCTFRDNSAELGGGMNNLASFPTLIDCTFTSNSAYRGGGMYNSSSSSPTLTDCSFSKNTAGRGGGMHHLASDPIVKDTAFIANIAVNGGGMFNSGESDPRLEGCEFTLNSAFSGGGISNRSSSPVLISCVLEENSADGDGGGIWNLQAGPALASCTVKNNSAIGNGGGMYSYFNPTFKTNPSLADSLICGNFPENISGNYGDLGANCVVASCDECDAPSDPCPTDLDQNGRTDGDDLGACFVSWGECWLDDCPADFNGDQVVDGLDLGILFSAWGRCE